ncbi:hypothetical protein [Faecalibacter rhinopitheci]|uniref:Uncharacterized protein n=1 Tax=Faecalibacter rhinopitheci TaxID=2779678 RepID=A0A8J7FVI6_9FLAO|nr:hypothetical protein [Faecalibacter rhinopitheci]MBF0597116.1 hypothetical protein [Faecalibacter rhinopitheci]
MENKKLITKPRNISELIKDYFMVFFNNWKIFIGFNSITVIGFFIIYATKINDVTIDKVLGEYAFNNIIYVVYFILPVNFITTLYLTFIKNKSITINNLYHIFSSNYFKITLANTLLCLALFLINIGVKSSLLMFQYHTIFNFIMIEFLDTILYFISIIIIYLLNPYKARLIQYFSKVVIKYIAALFFLLIISTLLHKITFNILIELLELINENSLIFNIDMLYEVGNILVEYCNTMATFTILIYIYYNFTSEVKNEYKLDQINQIQGLKNDED